MMVRALGVYRESEFSPGKIGADAAILDAVLANLAAQQIVTSAVGPAEFIRGQMADCDLILAMCQSEQALERLSAMQAGGVLVINSPPAIRACYRDRMGQLLVQAGVPVPEGSLVETSDSSYRRALDAMDPRHGIYAKRGDLHALSANDVRRVDDEAALNLVLKDFAARGIRRAYLQVAVEGRVVKFYGVSGTSYFSVADADSALSGPLTARLHEAAQHAAGALGLEVWGGDAIVSGDQFKIVDFNDWPSFEQVREQAAQAIARRVAQLIRGLRGEK
jgi:glutathione synthase/RimK-type ligase-like ATP-grasp enzyme